MTKIKAIFFDIDGTIRSFKTKTIPENTANTLKKLKEQRPIIYWNSVYAFQTMERHLLWQKLVCVTSLIYSKGKFNYECYFGR